MNKVILFFLTMHLSTLLEESTFPESAKNGRSKGITFGEQSDFMNSIKKEFTENIQAASKLEELKNFYQQRYGNL